MRGRRPGQNRRLRASPTFALTFSLDGRPYVVQEIEPYAQYWLSESERVLLSLFSGPRGRTIRGAVDDFLRLKPAADRDAASRRLMKLVSGMTEAGVLVPPEADTSRYDAAMADAYLTHRPFPDAVADDIIAAAPIGRRTRVLDLASGPGSLALSLARASDQVSMMELSRGFVAAAGETAARRGVALTTIHESCNRLTHHDQTYDVMTISQALHWLDDVAVCRGVSRLLNAGGSFFVVHAALNVADDHPLAYLIGDRSVLGARIGLPFADEVRALDRRLTLLFEALDSPDVQRIDPAATAPGQAGGLAPVRAAGVRLYRQPRPYGPGFARAFLSPVHVAATGLDPETFWADLDARCAGVPAERLMGVQDWAVLAYRRGGQGAGAAPVDAGEIGWNGPPGR